MATTIQFCGAARTVTGSKHLIRIDGKGILVDCGIFQGPRELRERNWEPLPFDVDELDAVVLTHAHMDHIGFLPRLIQMGYRGPVYATPATIGLAKISLPDSGRLQEEEAAYLNRKGLTRHKPALPLYTEAQAFEAVKFLKPLHYYQFHDLPGGGTFRYLPAGHILGSAFAEIYFPNGERIMMSGDLGRYNTPVIVDPTSVDFAEYLVIESTYGDRLHEREDVLARLEELIGHTQQTGGALLVPSFSIGRSQELLYHIKQLQDRGRIGRIPIFLDSPMAISASDLYLRSKEDHDKDMKLAIAHGENPIEPEYLEIVRDREQSKAINSRSGPMVVIAGSGMATGGRIVHHLLQRLDRPETTVLFTGYQTVGTLGRELLEGAQEVEIHGSAVQVRARIDRLTSLSAHADQGEMMSWLRGFKQPPKRTFIVHGEPGVQEALAAKIEAELGWTVSIPEQAELFELA